MKTEDWVRVRFGAGTPWRRCWCVISPPDEKEYQKLQKQAKKRSIYDRATLRVKGDVKFYDSKKTKKVKPIASITDAYGCHAIYPQSKPLIDQSTLIKVEGTITIHSQPPSTTEGFVFVMPEIHPAVSGFEMMLRWLFPAFDTFALYGRPERLIADTLDIRGLMFAMPNDRRYGYLEILDVAGLILTEGSQKWKEADWRRNLKELTAKRIKAMMADGGRQGGKSSTRRTKRASLQLPARNSALQFDDNLSTRSSPVLHPLRPDRSINGSPQKPGLASAPGSSFSPLRHQRSVSEAQGISRLQDQVIYDAPPLPPPHVAIVGVTEDSSRVNHSSDSNDVGNDQSSSDGDLQVSDQANASIQDLPPSNPPDPVVAPPAFAHAPGAKPASKPFHSPEQRWANSRMSTTTISQITGVNTIATAAAAAAWKPQTMDQESDAQNRTDGYGSKEEILHGGQQIQAMPMNSAEGDLRGVFTDANTNGVPADYSDAHKEVVTSAAGPTRSNHPLPLPPPEEFDQPLPRSRQHLSPHTRRLSSYEKELPPLNHELPLLPGAFTARTEPARSDSRPGYRSQLPNQGISASPHPSAGAFRSGSPELPMIPGSRVESQPTDIMAGASSKPTDRVESLKQDQISSDASLPPRDLVHHQPVEAPLHLERLSSDLGDTISSMSPITSKPVPDRSLSDKVISDSPRSSGSSGDRLVTQSEVISPVQKHPQSKQVGHVQRRDSNVSSYYGDDTANSPAGDAVTPDSSENSRPEYQLQGPWTDVADPVQKDVTRGHLENRTQSIPRPTLTQTPSTKSALRPNDGAGASSRPSTGGSSKRGAHGSSESSEPSKPNETDAGKRTVQFHPSTFDQTRPKSEMIEGKVGMGQGDHSRSGSESSSTGALRTPSGGHIRSRSFETDVGSGGRTIPWQPGMTTGGIMAKSRQGTVTPEQFVQQRATQARLTPVYAHQKKSSLGALHPESSSTSGRNSPPAVSSQRPLPHGRVPSTEFNPRPASRGMTMPSPAAYASPFRTNSSVDISSHLSAREQEHVARVTGSPLINMAGGGRPQMQRGGLVGAIEAREREKRELKEGFTGHMVQHAIMLRRQQEAQAQVQAQAQAQAQLQAQAQAQIQAQMHAQAQAQAQAQMQAQARYYYEQQQQQQYPGAAGFTGHPNRSEPQLGSIQQYQQQQQPSLTPQQQQQILHQQQLHQQLARQYPSHYHQSQQPPYGPYGQ